MRSTNYSYSVAALLAVVLVSVLLLCLGREREDGLLVPESTTPSGVAAAPRRNAVDSQPKEQRQPVEQATQKAKPLDEKTCLLRVTVRTRSTSAVLAGANVVATWGERSVSRITDAEGTALFFLPRGGDVGIVVAEGVAIERRLTMEAQQAVEVFVNGLIDVRIVTMATVDGNRIAGASVFVAQDVGGDRRMLGKTNAVGEFSIRSLAVGTHVSAECDGFMPSLSAAVPNRVGPVIISLVLESGGVSFQAKVVGEGERPVSGAQVVVRYSQEEDYGLIDGQRLFEAGCTSGCTDGDGRLALRLPEPSHVRIDVRYNGHLRLRRHFGPESYVDRELTIKLAVGALSGVMRSGEGAALAGGWVWAKQWRMTASTNSKGEYQMPAGVGSTVLVAGHPSYGRTETSVTLGEGKSLEWNPILIAETVVRGVVIDEDRVGLSGFYVRLCRDGIRGSRGMRTDEDGSFQLCAWPTGSFFIEVGPPDPSDRGRVLLRKPLGERVAEEYEIVVPTARMPSCFVQGRVVDQKGAAVEDASVALHDEWAQVASVPVDPRTGQFRIGPVPSGVYRARVWHRGELVAGMGPRRLTPNSFIDFGTTTVTQATIVLLFEPGPGMIELRYEGDAYLKIPAKKGGKREVTVPPGDYEIQWAAGRRELAVGSGERVVIRLD